MGSAIVHKMAGYGRFIFFIDSGNILCARKSLLNFYQNASRNALKYIHETALPPRPKKPLTAFFLYLNRVRSKLIEQNPTIKLTDVVKKASQEWAELDPIEKEDFRKQYNKNYQTYVQELKEYNDSLTDEQKQLWEEKQRSHKLNNKDITDKRRKETFGKPKKPLSAFLMYMLSQKNERDPNLPYQVWLQSMSANWKKMSDAEKQPYIVQFTDMLTHYKKDLEEWEMKMINLGHRDIVRRDALTKSKHIEQ